MLSVTALTRLAAISLLLCISRGYADVAVIAHPSVPVDTLTQQGLLDFYTGDIRSWTDKTAVVVIDLQRRGKVKRAFYHFLGRPPSRMKSIWMKNLLSSESRPPESLGTEEEVLTKVAATPGAVGFVGCAKVTDKVKTLILISSGE